MADEKGLAKVGSQDLALPDYMREDAQEGKADIDLSSITLPRLAIAQGLSPEMTPDSSAYIDGLRMFDMFNNLTGEVYGRGPLKFIPIQHHVTRIEFDPVNRGVVLDRDVPAGDPRLQFTVDKDGKKQPPKATTFTEVGVLLLHENRPPEPIVLSIKMTNKWQNKAANRVTMFIMGTPGPIFGSIKTVETKTEKNDKGTFGVFVIKNLRQFGAVEGDAQLYGYAKQFYQKIKGKVIDVQREHEDPTDFNPDEIEARYKGAETVDADTEGM